MARRKSGKKIDFVRWTLGSFNVVGLSAGQTQGVIISGSDSSTSTVLRTRGQLIASIDGTQAPASLVRVGVGFLVQQIGVTASVAPLTDAEASYFFYQVFYLGYEEMVTDVIDVPVLSGYRLDFDSKAMRILRPAEEVVCVVEQDTRAGAASINVDISARFLLGE